MTHYDLCKLTAEWALKKSTIVLWEYQSYATDEFPDVLAFKNGYTTLFEIKMSKQDFDTDRDKKCRIEKKIKYIPGLYRKANQPLLLKWKKELQEFCQEAPHLGRKRYYVCPSGLIQPEEIESGWGLYWNKGNRFYLKKESKSFKCNIYDEIRILEHAFRKYYCGDGFNILVNSYK